MDSSSSIKREEEEIFEQPVAAAAAAAPAPTPAKPNLPLQSFKSTEVIDLTSSSSSSSSSSDSDDSDEQQGGDSTLGHGGKRSSRASNSSKRTCSKKQKLDSLGIVLPLGFLDPLPASSGGEEALPLPLPPPPVWKAAAAAAAKAKAKPLALAQKGGCKQFWKAGDYEGDTAGDLSSSSSVGGMDHVRVHPKFLHSNATSHKWALGAFAELLDNSLDETCNGATFVKIDKLENRKNKSKMLLIEDNGGGMDPDKMRQCMSLGYSAKSKIANTIGQYGNGFKTSTMRLGADVIVFSRCRGQDRRSFTQSIGLLSYTFLRNTRKEDIVVPMLDYVREGREWKKLMRSSPCDWDTNVETIIEWSPYSNEAELLQQFNSMSDQGTRVIIYNLWEDDQGELELDFDADRDDIQIRGVNRDEKKIEMAKKFPNSRHFLTYRHSLRSYASILYLRLPPGFRMVLCGKDIHHHNIVNDMMLTQEITYKPVAGADGISKDLNPVVAVVRMGFVKDAKDHIDVQGFNVYHKNRLIKPFWRVWNPAGSDGRGVIGVLEANFVEPAHDKQGFERTTVLSRLEARLVQMQKTYWSTYCHKIGYAPRRNKANVFCESEKSSSHSAQKQIGIKNHAESRKIRDPKHGNGYKYSKGENEKLRSAKYGYKSSSDEDSDQEMHSVPPKKTNNASSHRDSPVPKSFHRDSSCATPSSQNLDNGEFEQDHASNGIAERIATRSQAKASVDGSSGNGRAHDLDVPDLNQMKSENCILKDRLKKMEESFLRDLEFERERRKLLETLVNGKATANSDAVDLNRLKLENNELKDRLKKIEDSSTNDLQYERERCKSLETKLRELELKIEEMNKEQEALIDIFGEERSRRDNEEESLRKKLKEASNTIHELLDKVVALEKMKSPPKSQL